MDQNRWIKIDSNPPKQNRTKAHAISCIESPISQGRPLFSGYWSPQGKIISISMSGIDGRRYTVRLTATMIDELAKWAATFNP